MDTRTMPVDRMRTTSEAAERLYTHAVSDHEKTAHAGQFVAIDTTSSRYAFGKTPAAALAALAATPSEVLPYVRPVDARFRLRVVPRR